MVRRLHLAIVGLRPYGGRCEPFTYSLFAAVQNPGLPGAQSQSKLKWLTLSLYRKVSWSQAIMKRKHG